MSQSKFITKRPTGGPNHPLHTHTHIHTHTHTHAQTHTHLIEIGLNKHFL